MIGVDGTFNPFGGGKTSDPFVLLECGAQKHKTKAIQKDLEPQWRKEHNNKVKFTATQYDNGNVEPGHLKVVVKDEGTIMHTQLGECQVDLNEWFSMNG